MSKLSTSDRRKINPDRKGYDRGRKARKKGLLEPSHYDAKGNPRSPEWITWMQKGYFGFNDTPEVLTTACDCPSCSVIPKSKVFFYSKTLSRALIYFDGDNYFAIPLTGNKHYGWDARRKVHIHPLSLIEMSLNEARLVATACGFSPEEF